MDRDGNRQHNSYKSNFRMHSTMHRMHPKVVTIKCTFVHMYRDTLYVMLYCNI